MQAANKAGPGLSEVAQLLSEMSSSGDGRLSGHTENVVRISYRRSIRSTTDPFKRAVYCIVAACDPADEHSEVATSLDDYLWIKLAQVSNFDTYMFIHRRTSYTDRIKKRTSDINANPVTRVARLPRMSFLRSLDCCLIA